MCIRDRVDRGIPVCGHLGLLPQSVNRLGGYRVQGREPEKAQAVIDGAQQLEQAGADILVLECVPASLGKAVTEAVDIPVIGIGAGANCDGQVLVLYDMLGITPEPTPKFNHDFLKGTDSVLAAVTNYVTAVKSGEFPAVEQQY